MNDYNFIKGLSSEHKQGRLCFTYADVNAITEMGLKWKELKKSGDIEIIWRQIRDNEKHDFYTLYWFVFKEEGLTESYKDMVAL